MKIEKKVTISFTEEEKSFLKELNDTIDTAICDQYEDKCDGCPFSRGASVCAIYDFFEGLKTISNYDQ